jgi:hypothetical protein
MEAVMKEMINEFWNEFWYELNAEKHYARACIAIIKSMQKK